MLIANTIIELMLNFNSGGRKMTPKELLYIEDALGHAKFMMTQFSDAAQNLTDPALKQQVQQFINKNQDIFTDFYGLI